MDYVDNIYEVPLSEYWRIVKKRRVTVLLVFTAAVVSTLIFTQLQTPIYEASIELKIEKSIPIGKDISAGAKGGADTSLDLGTELRLFKSLNVLSKVVEKVEVLPVNPDQRAQALHAKSLEYQNLIRVEQIPDTTIIVIHAKANSPEQSQLLANAVADVYIAENTHGKKIQL